MQHYHSSRLSLYNEMVSPNSEVSNALQENRTGYSYPIPNQNHQFQYWPNSISREREGAHGPSTPSKDIFYQHMFG